MMLLPILLAGCLPQLPDTQPIDQDADGPIDQDGDGYTKEIDCNDEDDTIHPGAEESCYDGIDSNCSEHSEYDCDEDGFDETSRGGNDCNDEDPAIHPDAQEIPGDHVDQDCDGIDPCSDLNCDGWPDIFFSSFRTSGPIFRQDSKVYWGSSVGFDEANVLSLSTTGAQASSAGDLNGDGFVDLAVPMAYDDILEGTSDLVPANEVAIYWGSTLGPSDDYNAILEVHLPHATRIADIDSDGYQDLLVTSLGDGTEELASVIFWGSRIGPQQNDSTPLPIPHGVRCIAADLDEDGDLDVAIGGDPPGTDSLVRIYWNGGERNFPETTDIPIENPRGIDAGDLNGDGHVDLVIADWSGDGHSFIYWGPEFESSDELPTNMAEDAAIADLNADGYPDITFANFRSGGDWSTSSFTYWGSEDGFAFDNRMEFPTHGAYGLTISDTNLDGHLDIVVANMYNNSDGYVTSSSVFEGPMNIGDSPSPGSLPVTGGSSAVVIGGGQ